MAVFCFTLTGLPLFPFGVVCGLLPPLGHSGTELKTTIVSTFLFYVPMVMSFSWGVAWERQHLAWGLFCWSVWGFVVAAPLNVIISINPLFSFRNRDKKQSIRQFNLRH